jgi:phytoene/squalene synthetase
VSQDELSAYTGWLATAVTEAMHHFIGNGAAAPHDETRYLAVTGAHILHMLRDTFVDLRAGYFNVPREVLDANGIGPGDIGGEAYRNWVQSRVELARACLDAGKVYFARVHTVRHRLAGLAYIARFEWLIDTLEREDFRLRPDYGGGGRLSSALRTTWLTVAPLIAPRAGPAPPTAISPSGSVRS